MLIIAGFDASNVQRAIESTIWNEADQQSMVDLAGKDATHLNQVPWLGIPKNDRDDSCVSSHHSWLFFILPKVEFASSCLG